jgi:hypothetical protein
MKCPCHRNKNHDGAPKSKRRRRRRRARTTTPRQHSTALQTLDLTRHDTKLHETTQHLPAIISFWLLLHGRFHHRGPAGPCVPPHLPLPQKARLTIPQSSSTSYGTRLAETYAPFVRRSQAHLTLALVEGHGRRRRQPQDHRQCGQRGRHTQSEHHEYVDMAMPRGNCH